MLSRAKASNPSSQVGNSGSLLSEEAQNFKRNFCQTERKTQKFVEQLEAAQDSNVEVVSFIMCFFTKGCGFKRWRKRPACDLRRKYAPPRNGVARV